MFQNLLIQMQRRQLEALIIGGVITIHGAVIRHVIARSLRQESYIQIIPTTRSQEEMVVANQEEEIGMAEQSQPTMLLSKELASITDPSAQWPRGAWAYYQSSFDY